VNIKNKKLDSYYKALNLIIQSINKTSKEIELLEIKLKKLNDIRKNNEKELLNLNKIVREF